MTELSIKKQEILNRQGLVLKTARDILLKRGYHGLTMARIAAAAGCPKATVYKHFPCKEEIIIALATESVEVQRALVERAGTFRGRPRERMAAVGVATQLFAELHADDSRIFQIVNGEAIFQKASEKSIWRLQRCGLRTVSVMLGIVRDAIAQGDLVLPPNHSSEDIIYNFWLLGEGGKAAPHTWLPPGELGIDSPFASVFKTGNILADGYGWRPLSSECDYRATIERVWCEVFPAERRKVLGRTVHELETGIQAGEQSAAEKGRSKGKEVLEGR
jgi:AcrR family transcriptional regulator